MRVVANLPERGGVWDAGSTMSGEGGRFRIEGIHTLGKVFLSLRPRCQRKPENHAIDIVSGEHTALGPIELTTNTKVADDSDQNEPRCEGPATSLQARILGPGGAPLEGIFVTAALPGFAVGASVSDPDGHFEFRDDEEARAVNGPYAWYLGGLLSLSRHEVSGADGRVRLSVQADDHTGFEVKIAGVARKEARLSWLCGNRWISVSSLGSWAPRHRSPSIIRLEAPGWLPQVRWLEETQDDSEEEELKKPVIVEFSLDSRTERSLTIRDTSGPIPGAHVDVDQVAGGEHSGRLPLGSWRTDDTGRLTLKGRLDREGYVQVYIYAEGYEAATSLWNPGEHRKIVLEKHSARVQVPEMPKGHRLRLLRSGAGEAARVLYGQGAPVEIVLAPGDYDAIFLDESNRVRRMRQFRLEKDQVATVPAEGDDRPTVTARVPAKWGDRWGAFALRTTVPSGPFSSEAWSTDYPSFEMVEPPSQEERISPRQIRVTLSGTGRHTLRVWSADLPYTLSREVVVGAGATLELDVPPIEAILIGSMRSYGGGKGISPAHGWAVPRLILLARGGSDVPEGWDITVPMPERFEDDFFELALPAGSYHLFQHLIGEPYTRTHERRAIETYRPVYGYGGIPVRIRREEILRLPDFEESPLNLLEVEAVDHTGVPVKSGILSIRDRMAEAWRQVELEGSTPAVAADRIPMPPERILDDNGRATFPAVRQGHLELRLLSGSDLVHHFSVAAHPGKVLRLQLPIPN